MLRLREAMGGGRRLGTLLSTLLLCGCSSAETTAPPELDLSPLGGDRPVEPIVPSSYDGSRSVPLVILLHGYGASGIANDLILGFEDQVDGRQFILLRPNGTIDSEGNRFWNATDACCDFEGTGVDDVGYISGLIAEARSRYDISRVALVGHSNGAYMTNRFACDRASDIQAFVSIAGSTWDDATKCQPDATVAALMIHGTLDTSVMFEGCDANRSIYGAYPGAVETTARWASLNGCSATAESVPSHDFSLDVDGAETEIMRHPDCQPGGAAELWTMQGESHLPAFNDAWRIAVMDFLLESKVP